MPKWREYRRYLKRNGWELYKSTDHDYYRKRYGKIWLTTRASFGDGEIPSSTWWKIKHQLGITDKDFHEGLK